MRAGVAAAAALALLVGCGNSPSARRESPVPGSPSEGHATQVAASPSHAMSSSGPSRIRPVSIEHGSRKGDEVALTFDADMTPGMIAQLESGEVASWFNRAVIKELRRSNTPATIFLTGLWTKTYPSAVRDFASDPLFELANHSWDHAAFQPDCYGLDAVTSNAGKKAEVSKAHNEIERVSGASPFYFRFPGGCHDTADLRIVAGEGEQVVGWDVVSGDAFQPDPDPIVQAVLERVRGGSIIVMHLHGGSNAPATDEALRRIIPQIRERGLRFVTLSQLLGR